MNLAAKVPDFLRAALAYAARGLHVFPLVPGKKEPMVARGFLHATTDPERIRSWWGRSPRGNIGLWPGQSGLLIVDLDSAEAEALAVKCGLLSEPTLQCQTGRVGGGRHLYFRRPSFHVSNAKPYADCDTLEVRCDAGYVVLPPSIHPSGARYSWTGKWDELRELPEGFREVLEKAQTRQGGSESAKGAAREIALEETISQGNPGRQNTLTSYAGRLIAKKLDHEEALGILSAINIARCKPPLPQQDVNTIVANIWAREQAKPLRIVGPEETAPPEIPKPADLTATQVAGATESLARDYSTAPRWAWRDVDKMTGPMLPGELVVIGALMGNGKTTFLLSQMEDFAARRRATLYIPLELDPEVCRLRWAAWKLGLDARAVQRHEWHSLPEGSREAIEGVLEEQQANPFIHFATPKRMTFGALAQWCRWALEEAKCQTVMLDHFHRLDFGSDGATHRVTITEVARRLKDLARELGVVMIASAQLNRGTDPVDQYVPPQLSRLKESSGIGEEADVVLMLSRKLRRDLPQHWAQELRLQRLSEKDLAEPNTMSVTCRKHRLDDTALNTSASLVVRNGRLENRYG